MKFSQIITPLAIALAGVLIAGAVLWNGSHPAAGTGGTPGAPAPSVPVAIGNVRTDNDPIIGDPNAPIAMAYWSDYQCPFCQRFDTTVLPDIIAKYVDTGKMRIVFKDFQFLGPDSDADALYARAVWHLYPDKFGAWHAAMYANQPQENTLGVADNDAHVRKVTASIAGIDVAKVVADMNANKATYEAAIAADRDEGAKFGINATPSFIVGSKLVVGALPYSEFQPSVEAALK